MNKIYSYLKSSEEGGMIIKGVKVLDKHSSRANQLIERLKAFVPEDANYTVLEEPQFVNQKNKEWFMYRNLAILAIDEYIREFPFLMHTPSSLRSIFGMPTRKDRKRGRYSGKELIDKALDNITDFSEYINYESVYELEEHLKEIINSYPEYSEHCKDLLEYLDSNLARNSQQETFVPEISTHSQNSLDFVKKFLQEYGLDHVIHERDEEYPYTGENKLFTPDLLGNLFGENIWFELKEWESFNIFFSPLKQICNYLDANNEGKNNKSYVGILVTQPVTFYEFLKQYENKELTLDEIRKAVSPRLNELKENLDNIHALRNLYLKIGRIMVKNHLQVKAESLYIGLFSEFINKELGMINNEYESGVQMLSVLHKLESRSDKILILPIEKIRNLSANSTELQNIFIIFLGVLPRESN